MKTCYIIGAGECKQININISHGDLVICADGGLEAAEKNSVKPDLIVGDFDSYARVPEGENVIVHPTEKDETDMLLAINIGLERGYKNFIIYGGLGGRPDHTYANIQLLAYLCGKDAFGMLVGCGYKIISLKNSCIEFSETQKGIISVFSFSKESRGVTVSGLKYQVSDITLSSDYPIGISNEFISKKAYVEVKDGTLIVMWEDN